MAEKKDIGEKLADKQWVDIQRKTFTKWCNSHIVKKHGNAAAISNMEKDFQNGIKLMELINALYGNAIPKHNKQPKMRPHVLDNITLAFGMLESAGVKTNFLKPFHLADEDLKMILGMVWAIILDYQIKGISVEELTAKEGLLLWCRKKTAGYKDVNVENFTTSWQDGLAFCALIHRHRPDLLDFDSLSKNNARQNLELAFDIAEKQLGIARLLDVEDIVDVARPDERSIVTYVSEYFHCFSAQDQVEAAGRRLAKWVALAQSYETLKNDYESKARALQEWINHKNTEVQDRTYDNTLQSIERLWEEFKTYKKTVKPEKTNEKGNVESAYNNLQALLRVNNRPAYVPPSDLTLAEIDRIWNGLSDEENKRAQWLRKELERQQKLEILASRFWRKAKALLTWTSDNKQLLSSNDFGSSVAEVEALLKNHDAFETSYTETQKRLESTKSLGHDLINQQYGKASEVSAKINELDNSWADLKHSSDTRRQGLEKELQRQNHHEKLRLEFATKSRAFVSWVEDSEDGEIAEPVHAQSLNAVEQLESSFQSFNQELSQKEQDYSELVSLAQSLSNEGITTNVYATFTIDQVTERWTRLQNEVNERGSALKTEHQRVQENDTLCKEYATQAKSVIEWIEHQKDQVTKATQGSLEDQLQALSTQATEISSHRSQLDKLNTLNNQVEERNIPTNPYTEETVETVTLAFENLSNLVSKQQRLIEKELLNQTGSKVSEEQLAEFRETFKNFDKDNNGVLEKHEFKACLNALGHNVGNDEAVDRLMTQLCKTTENKITFQEFCDYMVSRIEDSDSPTVIKNAFKQVAGNKDFVTEDDLRRVPGLTPEVIKFLTATMPQEGNGFNYAAFTDSQYRA